MSKNAVKATRERQLITYSEHWHTSRTLLTLGLENREGCYHQFLASIVFTAFSLEAFLNHIGEIQFETWDELEKLSPKGKIRVLAEKLDVNADFGKRPWQVVPEVFGIRNKIAHGKNELLEDERMLSIDTYDKRMGEMLKAPWQEYATAENAENARDEVEIVIREFWEKVENSSHLLFSTGMQTGSATLMLDEV